MAIHSSTQNSIEKSIPALRLAPFHGEPLRSANASLDDRDALELLWAQEGYWFFNGLIDHDLINPLTSAYLQVLTDLGQIEPGDTDAVWTGADLETVPSYLHRLPAVGAATPWRDFICHPGIVSLLRSLFASDPIFLPVVEMRVVPPFTEKPPYIHQDGFFYNGAVPMVTMWIPLTDISEDLGGLGVWQGTHCRPYLHNAEQPAPFHIAPEDIPQKDFRHSSYRKGDVIFFHEGLLHCGVPNLTNRFRLSLDVRFVLASAPRPLVGRIVDLSPDWIVVDGGEIATIPITDNTYIRGSHTVERIARAEVSSYFSNGDLVTIGLKNGGAAIIRKSFWPG